ncbi:MAG TPA: DNA-processing protein DprA, partial [Solirubrobacteraceae bacterium]|nr:DNA-processing protein DprA [Solirubrobacteraceae bacterium]
MNAASACDECLARAWLLARLASHLDVERERLTALLDLGEEDLIRAVAGRDEAAVLGERRAFDPRAYRTRCAEAGLAVICRCDPGYPPALWALSAEPAVLHVAGRMARFATLTAGEGVAIVGARRASPYALESARSLARGVGRAGVTVISGMAAGVDAAAHDGALEARGATVAVLPAAPQRPYPASGRGLHQRIIAAGAVISELGPDVAVRRWMFPARNRLIAALAAMTVVVAARRRSGALLTAALAQQLDRPVGAVPGQVTAPLSWGPHELVKHGASLVTEP